MTDQGGAPVRDPRVATGGTSGAAGATQGTSGGTQGTADATQGTAGGTPVAAAGEARRVAAGQARRVAAGEAVTWVRICPLDRLLPGRGAAARVGDDQVALFRVSAAGGGDTVFALGNRDPFSGAQVLARGIVGDAAGVPKVASPLYKQAFDLRTGACLDDPAVSVPSYPVRVGDDGWVAVGVSP